MSKVTPFLMFNDQLEAAMAFYTTTFPDSEIRNVARTGQDGPVTSAEFVIGGQSFMGYNGGPYFSFSQGISLFVDCDDQDEVDAYWNRLVGAGATPLQCGWITDQFGVTWQIVPKRFMALIGDQDPKKVRGVMDAMMTMVKLDVAALEKAYDDAQIGEDAFVRVVRELPIGGDAACERSVLVEGPVAFILAATDIGRAPSGEPESVLGLRDTCPSVRRDGQ